MYFAMHPSTILLISTSCYTRIPLWKNPIQQLQGGSTKDSKLTPYAIHEESHVSPSDSDSSLSSLEETLKKFYRHSYHEEDANSPDRYYKGRVAIYIYKLLLLLLGGGEFLKVVHPVPLGSQRSFLLHQSSESIPRQLGRNRLVVQVVRRIRKIVRNFLLCVKNSGIVCSRGLLRSLVSPQPYLSLLRCGSYLRHPLVKLRPVPHASERHGVASSSTASSTPGNVVGVPWGWLLIQVYVAQLVASLW